MAGSAPGSRDALLLGARTPAIELVAAGLCLACASAVVVGAVAGDDGAATGGPVLCPFRLVTGLPCPFCGMTRSLLALGRGDVRASVALHPLGPGLALVAVLGLWRFSRAALRSGAAAPHLPRGAPVALAAAFAIAWLVTLAHPVL